MCLNKDISRDLHLRPVIESDLPLFFEQQLDPDANYMAAFTAKDPSDRPAFDAHWSRIMADDAVVIRTILSGGQVAGHVLSYPDSGHLEVSYWIGKEYWGQGVATQALLSFLDVIKTRPLYARAAKDNLASLRVLGKCGFVIIGEARGFAKARNAEIQEFILVLESGRKQ
jgi:RimJ/RimL family protein N-acetyltransferase